MAITYGSSTAMTVTNLHSLASDNSTGYPLIGWSSAGVNSTTSGYHDYLLSGTFTTHASNRQAGAIYVYVVAALNTTPTWPAANSGTWGTEGAASFVDTEERDGFARLVTAIPVDTSASSIVGFPPTSIASLFGVVPPYWAAFVSTNATTTTTAGLASSGSAIYYTPITIA